MNRQQLLSMLEDSAAAYRDIQPALPQQRLIAIDNKRTGVQCFIRLEGDTMRVAFRGTDSRKDWATDFRFWKKTIPYGNYSSKIRVHTGFISAYKCPEIRGRIQSYVTGGVHRIQVMGHSYGAALAVLCAVDLQYNFPDRDIEVALFGCPRVGNTAFQRSYNNRVFKTLRVENGNDIVTKIPFCFMGYRHVGIRLHVGTARLPGLVSFEQHRPQRYYQALWHS